MKNIGCFIAGTLVHTDKGLMPIEQIKVGDMVLSKPESGEGEQAYKRVVRTFKSSNKQPIVRVRIGVDYGETGGIMNLFCTEGHQFWDKEQGWTPAVSLNWGDCANSRLTSIDEGKDGGVQRLDVYTVLPVYESETDSGIGVVYQRDSDAAEVIVDFTQDRPILIGGGGDLNRNDSTWYPTEELLILPEDPQHPDTHRYLDALWNISTHQYWAHVYNIEVEDFHTYYVGQVGVWVHNDNCH